MMRAGWATLIVIGVSMIARNASVAADAAYGEYLAAECSACHRVDAASAAIPSLRFLSYEYLVAALRDYRDGTRANTTMQSIARSLGDAEIEALAAYFSGIHDDP
jgi:cytochrome c